MNTEEKRQKKHRCKICFKIVLGSNYNLKSHSYQHGIIRPRFKCPICPKEYFRRDIYERHVLVHEGKAKKYYICDHCDRSFVDKRNLIVHLKIHDDLFIKPRVDFKCIACGVVYHEKRLLNHHIRKLHFSIDGQSKPNFFMKKCNETWVERVKQTEVYVQMTKVKDNMLQIKKCDVQTESKIKQITTKQNLEYLNTFKGEDKTSCSKAICDYCKKEMLKKTIESHIRKEHTKIFNCKECKKNFTSHYNMVKHMCSKRFVMVCDKSQYSIAICDYCKKEMLKKSLKSHIRERHLNIRRFECKECGKQFYRHYQMVNHACGKYKRKSKK